MVACAGLSVSQTGKLKETSRQWIISEQAKNGRRRDREPVSIFSKTSIHKPRIYIYIYIYRIYSTISRAIFTQIKTEVN